MVRPDLPCSPRRTAGHPHLRIGRTGRVFEALLPAIIEQKVTGQEAFGGSATSYGATASPRRGQGPTCGSRSSRRRRPFGIPSWEWLRLHIDPARSRAIVRAARVADSLERLVGLDADEADRRLRSLPGSACGPAPRWPRALGDADAVSRRLPRRQGRGVGPLRPRHRRRRAGRGAGALPPPPRPGRPAPGDDRPPPPPARTSMAPRTHLPARTRWRLRPAPSLAWGRARSWPRRSPAP